MFNKALNGRRAAVARVIAAVLAFCCIFSLCSCSGGSSGESSAVNGSQRRKQVDIHKSIQEMLGFDIDDGFIDGAEISNDTLSSESYGKIKIQVKEGKEDELSNFLSEKFGRPQVVASVDVPRYQEHQYANELRMMSYIRYFVTFKSGDSAKSIPINIYLATQNQVTFLYIFG